MSHIAAKEKIGGKAKVNEMKMNVDVLTFHKPILIPFICYSRLGDRVKEGKFEDMNRSRAQSKCFKIELP